MARATSDDHLDDHDAIRHLELDRPITTLLAVLSRTYLLGWLYLVSLD